MTDRIHIKMWDEIIQLDLEYDCYKGEEITDEQIKALGRFVSHPEWIDAAKECIEEYCKKCALEKGDVVMNVKDCIIPEAVFVKRESKCPRVAIMCKFRYDPEHGLAMVFNHEGTVSVGIQDIII